MIYSAFFHASTIKETTETINMANTDTIVIEIIITTMVGINPLPMCHKFSIPIVNYKVSFDVLASSPLGDILVFS